MNRKTRGGCGAAAAGEQTGLALVAPQRGRVEHQLERLKNQLLASIVGGIPNKALVQELRWVANEAAALAWTTVCPLLVLPDLLEEKVRAALQRWEHQQKIQHLCTGKAHS